MRKNKWLAFGTPVRPLCHLGTMQVDFAEYDLLFHVPVHSKFTLPQHRNGSKHGEGSHYNLTQQLVRHQKHTHEGLPSSKEGNGTQRTLDQPDVRARQGLARVAQSLPMVIMRTKPATQKNKKKSANTWPNCKRPFSVQASAGMGADAASAPYVAAEAAPRRATSLLLPLEGADTNAEGTYVAAKAVAKTSATSMREDTMASSGCSAGDSGL
mmetsp:Transcript_80855/g.261212  ORF Transcript_80855/g.261212 Transcript_80855/m.261212 type:complete len:212 (-) Transcript_80855:18-653(-)